MNSRFKDCPEIIATIDVWKCDRDGKSDKQNLGDKVVGISVNEEDKTVILDVREFRNKTSVQITIELSELVSALSLATLNAQ